MGTNGSGTPGRRLRSPRWAVVGLCLLACLWPLTERPAMASPRSGDVVYAGLLDVGQVAVIDASTDSVVATVPVGGSPQGIGANQAGTQVYALSTAADTVSVIDTATNAVSATIPLPRAVPGSAYHLAVAPSGSRVYATYTINGAMSPPGPTVAVIDTSTDTVTSTIALPWTPGGLAVSPDGGLLYVTDPGDGALGVVDSATGRLLSTMPLGITGLGPVVLNGAGTRAYVAGNAIAVVNTRTGTVLTTIAHGGKRQIAVNQAGTRLYAPGGTAAGPAVINPRRGTVLATAATALDDFAVALAPSGRTLYVIDPFEVSVVDIRTDRLVATVPVAGSPTVMAVVSRGTS